MDRKLQLYFNFVQSNNFRRLDELFENILKTSTSVNIVLFYLCWPQLIRLAAYLRTSLLTNLLQSKLDKYKTTKKLIIIWARGGGFSSLPSPRLLICTAGIDYIFLTMLASAVYSRETHNSPYYTNISQFDKDV